MQRLHLHINVEDLERSVGFYSTLFGAEPTVRKSDYAKWMLDDPRVNLAISQRGQPPGIDHVGVQAETGDELGAIAARLKAAENVTFDEQATTCCYARSDKSWVQDPSGVRWETFHTLGEATVYGEAEKAALEGAAEPVIALQQTGACCGA